MASYVGSPYISQSMGISDTTIYLSFVDSLPSSGTIQIESELVYYSGKDLQEVSLTGVIRGLLNTTAATHAQYIGIIVANLTTSFYFSDPNTLTMFVKNPVTGDRITLFNFIPQVS